MTEYVLNFEQLNREALPLVGGKNASLGELIHVGVRVPCGFAVTTASYLEFLRETGIEERIAGFLAAIEPGNIPSLNAASENIQALILGATIPARVIGAIEQAYADLCATCRLENVAVAVRSSATAEDLPTASFAGQQDTYLWVLGKAAVIDKIRHCWASLFTSRAIDYRVKNRFPHEKVLISVGVQKMVNAKAAGVLFTLNPTDGDRSKVVIEGNWGLGETVVSGAVNPDKFVVDKVVLEINERTVSAKHIECVFDADCGQVVNREVAAERQTLCCLRNREVKELARQAKGIEKHYGSPMDIEWSIDQDIDFPENIFIVQARPETVWSRRQKAAVIGGKSGYQLLMEQAMKRIKIPK